MSDKEVKNWNSDLRPVRVRFAPSPTGPLHIGGVRTALYNYLFAKKHGGTFILRIEDTDQKRYVAEAENYIQESLNWFGLHLDEGPSSGGNHGPYRQSERKDLYGKYALELVEKGLAYYAFDTSEDLVKMREDAEKAGNQGVKYNVNTRGSMKNSLSLSEAETKNLLETSENVTIRLNIPKDQTITFTDIVRGEVSFSTNELDDKIILKNDGLPTYHLANIIDDHLMEISHVIRGEEWLSSTAHHVIMYQFFGWDPPQFAHLPLILKPSGKGKLSKRDGAKFGFPVFPLEWNGGEEKFDGFKEAGFDPKAVINFLAFLGWSPGDEREIMSLDEMVEAFSLERIVKSGARFDHDKALWYNQQYILQSGPASILDQLRNSTYKDTIAEFSDDYMLSVINLMKERVQKYDEIITQGSFLIDDIREYDLKTLNKKYKPENQVHFDAIRDIIANEASFTSEVLANNIKGYITQNELGFGAFLPVMRILLTGTMKGPDLFEMMELLGQEKVLIRWEESLKHISK